MLWLGLLLMLWIANALPLDLLRILGLIPLAVDWSEGISFWVPCLFYGSWFLWAIVAAFATRSYQLRTKDWRRR